MKTLKSTIAVIALLFVGIAANAAGKTKADKATKSDIVTIYINAISNSKADGLGKVLDDGFQFNMKRGENVNSIDKTTFLKSMANGSASNAPVNTNTIVMQDDDSSQKVKIAFNYDGFVRTDVVTLNYSFGWKITSVTSSYK
jgi:uncharacterized membrane-anchored protein